MKYFLKNEQEKMLDYKITCALENKEDINAVMQEYQDVCRRSCVPFDSDKSMLIVLRAVMKYQMYQIEELKKEISTLRSKKKS